MDNKKKALGKGLSALLSSPETDITSHDISGNFVAGAIANIRLNVIEPNPFQPRTEFNDAAIEELAQSIKEQGLIQPITVRKVGFDKYQIISGERRFRASIRAELKEIPAYIKVANDQQMLEMALVENIQRRDLNAIEIGISYQRLLDECHLSQEELSEKLGKGRSTITNFLRLLKLPALIQQGIIQEAISMGHARALISLESEEKQLLIYENILANQLSVRDVESIVKLDKIPPLLKKTAPKKEKNTSLSQIQKELAAKFNTKIQVKQNDKGKGDIIISFKSPQELERITNLLK